MKRQFRKRRQFIKLASGLLAAPFAAPFSAALSGSNAFAATGKPPLRFLTVIESYGVPAGADRNKMWIEPTEIDKQITNQNQLGTILSELKNYQENMLVVSGLNIDNATGKGHQASASSLLTGSQRLNSGAANGAALKSSHASLDVHIGNYLNNTDGLSSGRPYAHLFFSNVSQRNLATFCYDTKGNQIRSTAGINAIAKTFLGASLEAGDDADFKSQIDLDVLGFIQEQIQGLRGQLVNVNAKTVMDAYQHSVDELASELQALSGTSCSVPVLPNSNEDIPNVFKAIGHIFSCNLASSITYAIGGECTSLLKHPFLYNAQEHKSEELKGLLSSNAHVISHETSSIAMTAQELVRAYQAREVAVLLDTLKNTIDLDGSRVLDNTVVFLTSPMSHFVHKGSDFAQVLIAGKNTRLKGGYHYNCSGRTHNDLLTTIAQGLMLPDDNFGGNDRNGNNVARFNNGPISKMLV